MDLLMELQNIEITGRCAQCFEIDISIAMREPAVKPMF
jgi:hypothetical protein